MNLKFFLSIPLQQQIIQLGIFDTLLEYFSNFIIIIFGIFLNYYTDNITEIIVRPFNLEYYSTNN